MTDHHSKVVFDLMAEIQRMEDVILYYQNRILKKQIAVAEILASAQVRKENKPEQKASRRNVVCGAARAALNGTPMSAAEICSVVREQFPLVKRNTVGAALYHLVKRGEFVKTGSRNRFKYTKPE